MAPPSATPHASAQAVTQRPIFAPWKPQDISHICIVGGGNAAHLLAAILSHARYKGSQIHISMLAMHKDQCERLEKGATPGGITVENPDGSSLTGLPDVITGDPKEALQNAQIVLISLPAFALPVTLHRIAPHVREGAWVGAMPASAGYQWIAAHCLKEAMVKKGVALFGTDVLPFACRVLAYGRAVKLYAYKKEVGLACTPNDPSLLGNMLTTLNAVVPFLQSQCRLIPLSSFLVCTLSPSNACMNPPILYGLFREKRVWGSVPLLYEEMNDTCAQLIDDVAREWRQVCRALEVKTLEYGGTLDLSKVPASIVARIRTTYEVEDPSSTKAVFSSCVSIRGIGAPMVRAVVDGKEVFIPDWHNRMFREETEALCVLRGLAEMINVEVPVIDKIIRWNQKTLPDPHESLREGADPDRDGGMLAADYWGLSSLLELVEFHRIVEGSPRFAQGLRGVD